MLRSRDGGRTWQAVDTGLPTLDVRRVAANRRGGVLAVTASGVYASKNDGDTWQALPGLEGLNLQSAVLGDDGIAYAATLTTLYRSRALTSTANDAAEKTEGVLLSIWPNPAHGTAQVRFTVTEAGPAHLSVYDALGREVARAYEGVVMPEMQSVPLDVSAWTAGVYVVRLVAGGGVQTARLVVVR